MQGLGSVKRKRKKAKGSAPAKRRKKRSVAGVGAIAGVKRRRRRSVGAIVGVKRRRRRTVGVAGKARRKTRRARGFGAIGGGNKYISALIRGGEVAIGVMGAAAATQALFKNADPEKDKKIKVWRGPAAIVVGLGLMIFGKNPHLENIGTGMVGFGFMRGVGDFVLKDKKDKIGLGIAEDVSGYDGIDANEMGDLPLYGDTSLMAAQDLYGVESLYGYQIGDLPLASPEDRFSGYQVRAGELTPMQGIGGPFEDAYARGNDNYRRQVSGAMSGLGYSLMN